MKEQMKKAEEKMQKTLAALDKEFTAIRAGRLIPPFWIRLLWITTAYLPPSIRWPLFLFRKPGLW